MVPEDEKKTIFTIDKDLLYYKVMPFWLEGHGGNPSEDCEQSFQGAHQKKDRGLCG